MYSIVTCINGNFKIEAEGLNEQQAKVLYHQKCAALWNASDVLLGQVSILNQQLQVFRNYTEQIIHTAAEPEQTEE